VCGEIHFLQGPESWDVKWHEVGPRIQYPGLTGKAKWQSEIRATETAGIVSFLHHYRHVFQMM
jgi:hypothetical protein